MKAPAFLQAKLAFVAIREYAAHSYLYYDKDSPIIEDHEYDALCKWLLENFSWIKPHDINNYIRKDMLECGSGYDIKVIGLTKQYAELLLADHGIAKAAKQLEEKHDPFD